MKVNSIYFVCVLWLEGVSFQTRHVGASSISDLVAIHPVNLSGNCMPLPQEGAWSGFIQQTLIAFIQHSHDFTQCSSSYFTGIQYTG